MSSTNNNSSINNNNTNTAAAGTADYSSFATCTFGYSSSTSASSSNATNPGSNQHHSSSYTQTTSSNSRDGTTIHRSVRETGQPDREDTRHYPAAGSIGVGGGVTRNGITGIGTGEGRVGDSGRIQDVTEDDDDVGGDNNKQQRPQRDLEQEARDREYEERMEDEYAKREGGA